MATHRTHCAMQFLSAVASFDILRNYANLPYKDISELVNLIDDPSNGMALDSTPHDGFDAYDWGLMATEVSVSSHGQWIY